MTDLHSKIVERIGNFHAVDWEEELSRQEQALRAVAELHAPRPCTGMDQLCAHLDPHNVCSTCGSSGQYVIGDPDSTARCATVLTIAENLGITEGDQRA